MIFLQLLILLLLSLLLLIFAFYSLYALFRGAPFVPTSYKRVKKMLFLAGLKPGEKLIDLGSGDGRIVFLAAKSGAESVGVEINPVLFCWSVLLARLKGLSKAKIIRKNLWDVDLSSFAVLTLFFIPPKMNSLAEKIKREMKPGSRVVSNSFTFPNWQYETKDGNIYLYKV